MIPEIEITMSNEMVFVHIYDNDDLIRLSNDLLCSTT